MLRADSLEKHYLGLGGRLLQRFLARQLGRGERLEVGGEKWVRLPPGMHKGVGYYGLWESAGYYAVGGRRAPYNERVPGAFSGGRIIW